MVVSLSQAVDATRPAEAMSGRLRHPDTPPASLLRYGHQTAGQRNSLDLRDVGGLAQLRRANVQWPELSPNEQRAWLARQSIMLPPRAVDQVEIALLPGGAVALRGPEEMLVCDPDEGAIFNQAEVKQLRRLLRNRSDITHLIHTADGVARHNRLPKHLPPQAVSVVPNMGKLPFRTGFTGPALVQWGHHGAVARPLVAVSGLLALAASLAASPQDGGEPAAGSVIVTETWQAETAADRYRLIAVALAEYTSDLIAATTCDQLRVGLMEACTTGPDSLAARIARALDVLPTCFAADPDTCPGRPPEIWRHAMAHIREAMHPRVLLGFDHLPDPLAVIRSLRDTLEHAEVLALGEDGDNVPGGPVSLQSDAALFLARKSAPYGRLSVAIPAPASPLDLYALIQDVVVASRARIIAVAPGWGFCHRVGPDGEESGNAGWFGMGVGLDEVDNLFGDVELNA